MILNVFYLTYFFYCLSFILDFCTSIVKNGYGRLSEFISRTWLAKDSAFWANYLWFSEFSDVEFEKKWIEG